MISRIGLVSLVVALSVACGDGTGSGSTTVTVTPLLDSLFVGDTAPPGAFTATLRDANGTIVPGAAFRWTSSDVNVATVDSLTGRVAGKSKGIAVIQATANGTPGRALVVVSRALELSLLVDTMYLMPGDTFTVPVDIRRKGGSPPPVRFAVSPNPAVYTIDTVSGKVTAVGQGLATKLIAHADTVADTGAVEVVVLSDTLGGKAFFTLFGTVTHRSNATVRGLNYVREGGTQAFRLNASISAGGVIIENAVITLLAPVSTAGVFAVDSLSPVEAFQTSAAVVCRPPRPWAIWSTRTSTAEISAVSRSGTLSIARVVAITHGSAISGSFRYDAQRTDFYGDPLALLPIRGTFVAPLTTDLTLCN